MTWTGYAPRANAGDGDAARRLAEAQAKQSDLDRLHALADAGDRDAAWQLADLLTRRGDLKGAVQVLRVRSGVAAFDAAWPRANDGDADWQLADLLAEPGIWTRCAPGLAPAIGLPPPGWSTCWPSKARLKMRIACAGSD